MRKNEADIDTAKILTAIQLALLVVFNLVSIVFILSIFMQIDLVERFLILPKLERYLLMVVILCGIAYFFYQKVNRIVNFDAKHEKLIDSQDLIWLRMVAICYLYATVILLVLSAFLYIKKA